MRQYFIYSGSVQEGPFPIEALKGKKLTKDTPVWCEGMDAWTVAGEIEELKDLFIRIPPPFKSERNNTQESQEKSENTAFKTKEKGSNATSRKLLVIAAIIVLILAGVFINKLIEQQEYQERLNAEAEVKTQIRNNITSYVTAERSAYNYSTLGGISNLSISVTNSTAYLIDKVKVRVIYIKTNGEVWDSKYLDFNLLDPHSKSTIDVADTYRGTSVEYEIVSIKSSALGLD